MIKSADQCLCRGQVKESKTKTFGDGGYRSPYLSHAKRALYHLSYVPGVVDCETELDVNHPKVKVTIGELELDLAWLCCLQQYTSLDSSVGRAVDCSCNCQTSIGRWFKSGSREFFSWSTRTWKAAICCISSADNSTDSSIV